ncbi:hypothetical protein NWF32_26685 [Pseudomonas qingdaonensis]|nr:hypothetical protein [Pseudomonas qingdaonensis]
MTGYPTTRKHLMHALGFSMAALLLGACTSATPPAPSSTALPAAPEIASGYRTGMAPVQAQHHMAAAANPWQAPPARRCCARAGLRSMPPLPCRRC